MGFVSIHNSTSETFNSKNIKRARYFSCMLLNPGSNISKVRRTIWFRHFSMSDRMRFTEINAHNGRNSNVTFCSMNIKFRHTEQDIQYRFLRLKVCSYIFHFLLSSKPWLYSVVWKTNSTTLRICFHSSNTAVIVT
jgi:hypothetical protein